MSWQIHKDLILTEDSLNLYFGEEQDYSIQWDGNNALHTISAGAFIFNGNIISDTDSADDLGSGSIFWKDAYMDRIFFNETSGIGKMSITTIGGDTMIFQLAHPTVDLASVYEFKNKTNSTSQNVTLTYASISGGADFIFQRSSSNITFAGGSTINFKSNNGFIFNSASGANGDVMIRGQNDANLFRSDASTDRIGIGTATPDTKLQVVGVSRFGEDTTNYAEFESDGTLEFNGTATVWKDINMGAASLSGPPGLQPGIVNYLDEGGGDTGIATYGLAVGEGFSGQFEMQHDYKEGTDITFHVHWQGITAPTGTDKVKFQLTYTMAKTGETLDAATVITLELDYDTQYEFKNGAFAAITGTDFGIEDQFLFTVERIAASADEYGGEALVATVGIHYETDTIGSRQILAK